MLSVSDRESHTCGQLLAEFTDALCPTQWVVQDGKLTLKGEIEAASKAEKLEWKPQEEQIDAFGNVVKIKVPAPLHQCMSCASCNVVKPNVANDAKNKMICTVSVCASRVQTLPC